MRSLISALFVAALLPISSSAFAQSAQPTPTPPSTDSLGAISNGDSRTKIEVGSQVRLGPLMTVTAIEGEALCQWHGWYAA
jgi:hypothetical protein